MKISAGPLLLKILSLFVATLLAAAEICAAAPKNARASDSSFPRFQALPLTRSGQNHLLVHARINGRRAVLMVDSGAPTTLINSKRRSHFRLTRIGNSSKLPTDVLINGVLDKLAIARSLRLGVLDIVDIPVVVADISVPRRAARMVGQEEIDGILGVDVLFGTRAVMDCEKQVLILDMDPEAPSNVPSLDLRGFHKIRMNVSEGFNLYVNSSVNGTRTSLLVDTGAVMTTLHLPFVRQMRIPYYETPFTSSGVNRKEDAVNVAEIRRLSVGSLNVMDKAIGVADLGWLVRPRGRRQSSRPFAGLLGAEILRTHHGIIDFGTRTLYLKN